MLKIIKRQVFTKKTIRLLQRDNKYIFAVQRQLTKTQVQSLMEKIFLVRIFSVNIYGLFPKRLSGRGDDILTPKIGFKRVIIVLSKREEIIFFEEFCSLLLVLCYEFLFIFVKLIFIVKKLN